MYCIYMGLIVLMAATGAKVYARRRKTPANCPNPIEIFWYAIWLGGAGLAAALITIGLMWRWVYG